ncbi:MAG: YhdH/YhfP family quinone oxidoreductase [Bdellovibrionales bacterium]|nr:YhdH/YhfP family quinone oxidoreductase [Bdellovibrionales bacterium]
MTSFKALYSEKAPQGVKTTLRTLQLTDLPDGEVLIRSKFSSINYKDALGVTGKGKIFRQLPMVGGIDVSSEVIESRDRNFSPGDAVLVTGCGLGEESFGGYSEYVRVPSTSVVQLPNGLSPKEAMQLGTAGFTAALSLWRMQQVQQSPAQGPILITGASGGVGSFAVQIFSQAGFEVWALSGRPELHDYLKELGADRCFTEKELQLGHRPLESVKFGGVIDNVGGELLAKLLPHVQLWGSVASIGLAGGANFQTTVMPFILRGVSLLGVSSNNCTRDTRLEIWKNLSQNWKPSLIESIQNETVGLEEVMDRAEKLLNRQLSGRVLVKF